MEKQPRKDGFPKADRIEREHFLVRTIGEGVIDRLVFRIETSTLPIGFARKHCSLYTENLCLPSAHHNLSPENVRR